MDSYDSLRTTCNVFLQEYPLDFGIRNMFLDVLQNLIICFRDFLVAIQIEFYPSYVDLVKYIRGDDFHRDWVAYSLGGHYSLCLRRGGLRFNHRETVDAEYFQSIVL